MTRCRTAITTMVWFALFTMVCVWPLPPSLAAASPAPPARPVIFVHGFAGDASAWDESPLPGLLESSGYVRDKTLFVLDYGADSSGDYTVIAREHLMPLIDRAKAASGSDQVDLIAFSMGGLVSRYYLQSADYRDDVHTLVLIASPLHGSFAATLLRGWLETDVQALWPEPFRDEPQHMFVRERLPAYASATARFRAAVRVPPVNRTLMLLDWAAEFEPTLIASLTAHPGPVFTATTPYGDPTPAAGLTGSFYELLAAQTAIALSERPPLHTWRPLTASGDSAPAAITASTKEPKLIRAALALLRVFGLRADSAAVARMVEELSMAGMARTVRANDFLSGWNTALAEQRSQAPRRHDSPLRGTRHIVVASAMMNAWAPFRAGVGPNDGVVAVDSAVVPLERDDRFRLFSGALLHHLQVKNSQTVAEFIAAALQDDFQPTAVWQPPAAKPARFLRTRAEPVRLSATLRPGLWEPYYIDIRPPDDDTTGTLHVAVKLSGKAARLSDASVWAYVEHADGTWDTHELLYPGGGVTEASVRLPGFGADAIRVLIGSRRRSPAGGPATPTITGHQPVNVSAVVTFDRDGSTETPRLSAATTKPRPMPAAKPTAQLPVSAQMPADAVLPPPAASEPPPTPAVSNPSSESIPSTATADNDLPLIIAERTNRLTTNWREDITTHGSWTWDFGDGTTAHDGNPANVKATVSHTYTSPGHYTVTATATSNKGDIIRRQSFTADVAEPGDTAAFTAESIHSPKVDLTLTGPNAWLVGNTAPFTTSVAVTAPPHAEVTATRFDPGEEFLVLWKRPNHFDVLAAVRIDVTYRWPEGDVFKLRNTYVRKQTVEVMATGLTR